MHGQRRRLHGQRRVMYGQRRVMPRLRSIQRADAARYVILHAEGGVYADMDIEAFQSLDPLLNPAAEDGAKDAARPMLHIHASDDRSVPLNGHPALGASGGGGSTIIAAIF